MNEKLPTVSANKEADHDARERVSSNSAFNDISNGGKEHLISEEEDFKLREVGPLTHLIGRGIPIIPRPARMMMLISEQNENLIGRPKPQLQFQSKSHQFPSNLITMNKLYSKINQDNDDWSRTTLNPTSTNDRTLRMSTSSSSSCCNSTCSSQEQEKLRVTRLNFWIGSEETTRQKINNDPPRINERANIDSNNNLNHNQSSQEHQWVEYWDEEVGANYYYNVVTGEASWVCPS